MIRKVVFKDRSCIESIRDILSIMPSMRFMLRMVSL